MICPYFHAVRAKRVQNSTKDKIKFLKVPPEVGKSVFCVWPDRRTQEQLLDLAATGASPLTPNPLLAEPV